MGYKEWEFNPVIKKLDYKNILPKLARRTGGGIFKFVSDQVADWGLTMSATEEKIRTISFVLGVRRAMKAKLIRKKPISELKGEELVIAMEFGRFYSQTANFGLTQQDYPFFMHSPLGGGIIGKFKGWMTQKFADDVGKFEKGFNALLDYEDIIKILDDPKDKKRWRLHIKNLKKFGRTFFGDFGKGKYKVLSSTGLRKKSHEYAQLRDFLLIQGPMTLIMDVLLFGPAGSGIVKYALRKFGLQSVAGMRSDLLSLMIMPLTITLRVLLDDEDEDHLRWTVSNIIRHSFVGLGFQKPFDITWGYMAAIINQDPEEAKSSTFELIDPVIPFRGTVSPIIREATGVKRSY